MKKLLLLSLYLISSTAFSQAPKKRTSSEIQLMLNKLNVLGSVLYVAAHPDDENTRMIAYYANEELMQTAYLAATRGDGGQNLIGTDIREKLGIIRTQELLAARRKDGGKQFFSRANDFGYSKDPDETFDIWDRDKVLADFVWVIRKFKPDVMITRFSERPKVTHGHHTASAILAHEAYKLAGDENAYPEQLKYVDPWSPKKLYWNTSWWFYRRTGEKFDTTGLAKVDVGKYNPMLGKSYTEIAAESRSMHKSQGFGATGSRGIEIEYLKPLEGETTRSPFGDIDVTWNRVEGGDVVQKHIENALHSFDSQQPWVIVSDLLLALKEVQNLDDKHWKKIKSQEIKKVIKACMGLYLEAKSDSYSYVSGDSITISFEAINRSSIPVILKEIYIKEIRSSTINISQKLNNNLKFSNDFNAVIPSNLEPSSPYWLTKKGTTGMYTVEDQLLRGNPENEPVFTASYVLEINDQELTFESPVVFKRNDPVNGETYRPLEITPPVFVNLGSEVMIFGNNESQDIQTIVKAGSDNIKGTVKLELPKKWTIEPAQYNFDLATKGEEKIFNFSITPPKGQSEGTIKAIVNLNDTEYVNAHENIVYDHIPAQAYYPVCSSKIVKIDLKTSGNKVGYIMGAGDKIPNSLQQVGYNVDLLTKDDIVSDNLSQYDAVIVGIRAFNTLDWIKFKNKELFDYVAEGGNVIVQYNTSHRLKTTDIAPYSLKLSRDRVAVEGAPVEILEPSHIALNYPNKITMKDFDGWVQERGLYFPNEWSEEFVPLLSSNDPGEDPKSGGLLVAKHGKGYYVYTGYSWFRELPAGVPGAYRIFTNLISLGKQQ